jgi:hypothetical protein
VVGRVLVAFEAVREGSGRPGSLALLPRKEAEASLQDCPTFKTVVAIFVDPLRLGWALCGMDTWDETGRRRGGAGMEKMVLQPRPSPGVHKVSLN